MIDERQIELIHGEIDGENSPADSEAIRSLMEADPGLREIYEDLRSMSNLFEGLDPEAPPAGLRDEILKQIPVPERERAGNRWFSFGGLRLAAVFATGAAFMFGALSLSNLTSQSSMEMADLVGTMTSREAAGVSQAADAIRFDAQGVAGTVNLQRQDGLLVLQFDLSSDRDVQVVTTFDGQDMRYGGIAQLEDGPTSVTAQKDRISHEKQGDQRFALFLTNPGNRSASVELQFFADGKLVHESGLQFQGAK